MFKGCFSCVWMLYVLAVALAAAGPGVCFGHSMQAQQTVSAEADTDGGAPAAGSDGPTSPQPEKDAGTTRIPDAGNQNLPTAQPAPGTDASRFVPGSTVQSFNPFDSIKIGKVLIRPSGVIGYSYESNLLNDPTVTAGDHSVRLAPSVEAFIPVTANGIRLDYTMQWRDYYRYDLRQKFEHTFNADSQFDFTPVLSLALRDHFAVSNLDSREYVPSREVVFADHRFTRNEVEGQLNWAVSTTDNLGLRAGWNRVNFDQPVASDSLPFYDYSECRYSGFYRRSVSQRSSIFVDGTYRRLPTRDPRDIANSSGYEAVAGVETVLTPLISGQISVGMRSDRYPRLKDVENRALVLRGNIVKEITERDRISFSMSRGTGLSYFQDNAFILTQGYGVGYFHQLGRNAYFSVTPSYLRNSYPLPIVAGPDIPSDIVGSKRTDGMLEVAADARVSCNEWLAIEIWLDMLRRRSTMPDASFTDLSFGVNLLLGNRNATVGRLAY